MILNHQYQKLRFTKNIKKWDVGINGRLPWNMRVNMTITRKIRIRAFQNQWLHSTPRWHEKTTYYSIAATKHLLEGDTSNTFKLLTCFMLSKSTRRLLMRANITLSIYVLWGPVVGWTHIMSHQSSSQSLGTRVLRLLTSSDVRVLSQQSSEQ